MVVEEALVDDVVAVAEVEEILRAADAYRDGSGTIDYDKFFRGVRVSMNDFRKVCTSLVQIV